MSVHPCFVSAGWGSGRQNFIVFSMEQGLYERKHLEKLKKCSADVKFSDAIRKSQIPKALGPCSREEAKMFSAALAKQFKSLYSSELPEAAR